MSNVPSTVPKPMEAKRDIRTLIQSSAVREQMAMVLPKHLTADRNACREVARWHLRKLREDKEFREKAKGKR